MQYAVVDIKGNQYKLEEGDEVLVDKFEGDLEFKTLLLVNEGKVKIGQPDLKDAKLKFSVLGDEKGKKLHVFKYKSKSRYRRKIGSRQVYTRIRLDKIS